MPKIPYPVGHPLPVAELLDLSFRVYLATLVRCLPFAALAVIAYQLPNLFHLSGAQAPARSPLKGSLDPLHIALNLVGVVVALVLYGAVLLRQDAMCRGRPAGAELAAAARRVPGIVVFAIVFALALAPASLCYPPTHHGLSLLLLVPVGYFTLAACCAFPILLLSRAAALPSFAQSWRLTLGGLWRLCLIWTVTFTILLGLSVPLSAIPAFAAAVLSHGDATAAPAAAAVIAFALLTLATPLGAAIQLVVLGDLTARRAGAALASPTSVAA